jgi:formate--tetrahydrofolate ligase
MKSTEGPTALSTADVLPWGPGVSKVRLEAIRPPRAKHVVVTAVTPTKAGEGKTVTAIALVDGLRRIGVRAVGTLRQPSLGPVFGLKGGATGGGLAVLVPAERIDVHFTGDEHAVTAAHNLLAAFVENHVFQGNALAIDEVSWPRASPISDRALRSVALDIGRDATRASRFVISAASEVMAILALARDAGDLRDRLGRIVVGRDAHENPVTAERVGAAGAMAVLLRDALLPNLVATAEGTPVLVHAGPFANIAHGVSSLLADRVAAGIADVVVTEAGFGADLGFEKLVDIKVASSGGFAPDAAVLVASLRALRAHGSPDAGWDNLRAHLSIVRSAGVPVVVALNRFPDDGEAELEAACARVRGELDAPVAVSDGFARGGSGAEALGHAVAAALLVGAELRPFQRADAPILDNLRSVATRVYGASDVVLGEDARTELARLATWGMDRLPVCVAKTPLSLSHDPRRKGAPSGFELPVRRLEVCAGAGFVVASCGEVSRMPGLPPHPRGERMDVPR